jgi:hypothetical protein
MGEAQFATSMSAVHGNSGRGAKLPEASGPLRFLIHIKGEGAASVEDLRHKERTS